MCDKTLVDIEYFNRDTGFWDYYGTVNCWLRASEVIAANVQEARRSGNWAASILDWRAMKARSANFHAA